MVPLMTLRSANIKQHMEISMTRTHITLDTAWLRWLDIKSLSALYIEYPYLNEMIPLSLVFFFSLTPALSCTLSLIHFLHLCQGSSARAEVEINASWAACCIHCLCIMAPCQVPRISAEVHWSWGISWQKSIKLPCFIRQYLWNKIKVCFSSLCSISMVYLVPWYSPVSASSYNFTTKLWFY